MLEVPSYFHILISDEFKYLKKNDFLNYWKRYFNKGKYEIAFDFLLGENANERDYLLREDFKPFVLGLISTHVDYEIIHDNE